ncbi:MAG: DEAD/DEAH box helicase [Bacteroidetes bacterium]|nr:MAG: DEAD/DEAH box helicase [Bacteroidota bacterium]
MNKEIKKYSLESIIKNLNIDSLNEIQLAALEAVKLKKDLFLISPTGTGKTLAFLLALISRLEYGAKYVQAVILVPTRELALQIESVVRQMKTSFSVTCCYGGHSVQVEKNSLSQFPDIVIATPGRLADHISRGHVNVSRVQTLVLDEFDKSLEMGFDEEMEYIIGNLKAVNKKILTSATEGEAIPVFVGINNPIKLKYQSESIGNNLLRLQQVQCLDKEKLACLLKLLCNIADEPCLVFCNHRDAVERLSAYLEKKNIIHDYFHGGLEQVDREKTLAKFRNGSTRILIATDLAARGLDIPEIKFIIHFQLAMTEDAFVHRNGRTARMKAEGTAILLLNKTETIPPYINPKPEVLDLKEMPLPSAPEWETLFVGKGKKDKVNKIDLVGFLSKKGQLEQNEIGLIEVKDYFSYVAVRRDKIKSLIKMVESEKIKGAKAKIQIAR